MILIGGQSTKEAQVTGVYAFRMVQKLLNRDDIFLTDFSITNVVANAAVGFEINLVRFSQD
jgi:hypothetical protein